MSETLSQSAAFDFRNELYARIQRLSFSYHDKTQTGQLMIRATDDVEKVRLFIGQGLLMAAQALVMLTATLIILTITNPRLMLVILPVLPVALVMFMVFGAIAQPLFTRVQIKLSALNTILQENLAGIKVVKAFVREPQQQARFERSADDLMGQQITVARLFSFLFPLVFLIANLGQAAVYYFGGQQIIQGTLTFGEWQKFSLYLVYVFFPLGMLGMIITQMSQAAASAQRVFEILDTQSEVRDRAGCAAAGEGRGPGGLRERHLPLLRRRRAGAGRRRLRGPARADRGAAGRHRERQEHDHQPDPALLRPQRRAGAGRRAGRARGAARTRCARRSGSCCRTRRSSAGRSATTSPSGVRTPAWRRWSRRPRPRPPTSSS